MAKVNTNNITLAYSIETALGTPGTVWFTLEPNDISAFGPTIATTPRRPISKNRQRRKGTVTDLDSTVEIEHDLTMQLVLDVAEQFAYAQAAHWDTIFRAAPTTTSGFTIPAATANQAGKFNFNTGGPITLVFADGYANATNNGEHPLEADLIASGTLIDVTTTLVAEGTPPSNARVQLAGVRCTSGDLAVTVTGSGGTLTSGNNSVTGAAQVDFTDYLFAGQIFHIGGVTTNRFSAGKGYVRADTVSAASVTFSKLVGTLATDPGTGEVVDLLFGPFIRNVPVDADSDDNRYLERSLHFEATFPDLDSVGTDMYQYATGNLGNTLTFNIGLADKATVSLGFIGLDTEVPTTSRKSGAATPIEPKRTTAYNTSSDIVSLRTDVLAGADTCFKNFSITLNNNVSAEKCIGTLGAKFMNTGLFDVDIEAQALFTDDAIVAAIRNNTTVTLDLILNNENGVVAIDIPSLTLGGGAYEFPLDESVNVNLTGQAFQDPTLGTSIGISLIPNTPSS